MKRHTQAILYHLLPVAFWLLAAGVCSIPMIPAIGADFSFYDYIPSVLVLAAIAIVHRIPRHTSAVEQCMQVAVLLGVASYWVPTILFLILPIWAYLYYQNLLDLRAIMATFIGFVLVAIWALIALYMGWIANRWVEFFAPKNAWGWIPAGAIIMAYLGSTIVRRNLRVR